MITRNIPHLIKSLVLFLKKFTIRRKVSFETSKNFDTTGVTNQNKAKSKAGI